MVPARRYCRPSETSIQRASSLCTLDFICLQVNCKQRPAMLSSLMPADALLHHGNCSCDSTAWLHGCMACTACLAQHVWELVRCIAFTFCDHASEGERPQRARQLWRWMYYHGSWIRSPDDTAGLQDGFSIAFRHAAALCHFASGGIPHLTDPHLQTKPAHAGSQMGWVTHQGCQ